MTDLKTRRQYTDEEKARAVALAAEKGLTAASAELGVGKLTLWRWRAIAAGAPVSALEAPAAAATTTTAHPPAAAVSPTKPRARHVAKSWTPSQRAEIVEYAAVHGVSAASAKFKVSRFSISTGRRTLAAKSGGGGHG